MFVKSRLIFDNIALPREICREIGKRDGSPNIILSFDMHKAYDKLEWVFLFDVLLKIWIF